MKPNGKTPRRPIKREFLAALNAPFPLETWRVIFKHEAKYAMARDWLSK